MHKTLIRAGLAALALAGTALLLTSVPGLAEEAARRRRQRRRRCPSTKATTPG